MQIRFDLSGGLRVIYERTHRVACAQELACFRHGCVQQNCGRRKRAQTLPAAPTLSVARRTRCVPEEGLNVTSQSRFDCGGNSRHVDVTVLLEPSAISARWNLIKPCSPGPATMVVRNRVWRSSVKTDSSEANGEPGRFGVRLRSASPNL